METLSLDTTNEKKYKARAQPLCCSCPAKEKRVEGLRDYTEAQTELDTKWSRQQQPLHLSWLDLPL